MTKHSVVDHKIWLQKRTELLAREKESTQLSDELSAGYHLMDLTPRRRDEAELEFSMAWVRRRDEY